MNKFLSFLFAIIMLLASENVTAQNKFRYINQQELISVLPETRKADSTLQQYRAALLQNARDKQSSFEAAVEKFNKDSTTMTAPVKEVKRNELQKMLTDLQGEDDRMQQLFQAKQQQLIDPLTKKANDVIEAIAKEGGYNYVFDKRAVIIAPPNDDVINEVAKKLNVKLKASDQKQELPATESKK